MLISQAAHNGNTLLIRFRRTSATMEIAALWDVMGLGVKKLHASNIGRYILIIFILSYWKQTLLELTLEPSFANIRL